MSAIDFAAAKTVLGEALNRAPAEIPDDAWVLGFHRDGESFAYDLNLLNAHEVVNHGSERSRFAAVW